MQVVAKVTIEHNWLSIATESNSGYARKCELEENCLKTLS